MIPSNRFDPAKPLTGTERNRIRGARTEDAVYYVGGSRDAASKFLPSSGDLRKELSDFFHEANPFSEDASDLANAFWSQAVRDRYLELTGGKVEKAAPKVDPMDAWPPDRIHATHELLKKLRAGTKVACKLGCDSGVVYAVLSGINTMTPATRAKWLERIEKAVLEMEGVKGEAVKVDDSPVDTVAVGETFRWLEGMIRDHRIAEVQIHFRLAQGEVRG